MGKKLSVWLSDEAVENLSEIQAYLGSLMGSPISRSAALNSVLVKGAGLYLEDQREVRRAIARYTEGPLMRKALKIAREETPHLVDLSMYDRDKDHGDAEEEAAE